MSANLSIRVLYRKELLPLISSFVENSASVFGATKKETSDLTLATEEATMHILESFPADDIDSVFEITCYAREDGLEYVFNNLGLPVNPEALPSYNTEAPDESVEGLRLFLARKMADKLEFVNLGHAGWRTRIYKHLSCFRPLPSADNDTAAAAPAKKGKIKTSIATPDDAFDIVQLSYLTYRYSYAKESFYYAEKLKKELANGNVISFTARTESGKLIGQMAYIKDKECPAVSEVGMLMVLPEHRKEPGLLALLKKAMKYSEEHSGLTQLYTANLVTAHNYSQRFASFMNFKPMALVISTHERSRFLGIETSQGRESNLYAIRAQEQPSPFPVYVPEEHSELAARLFENSSLPAGISNDARSGDNTETVWRSDHNKEAQYVTISVDKYGDDFPDAFRKLAYQWTLEEIATTSLRLPAWLPLPPGLEQELQLQSFFFCGFVHATPDKWFLLYTRLTHQRFSFDNIQIFDPKAEELKQHVRQSYENLINFQPAPNMPDNKSSR